MSHYRLEILVLTATLAATGCSTSNVIAGAATAAQALFITDDQEVAIGRQGMTQIFAQTPEYTNPTVHAYVNTIGQKMVAQCERSTLPFEFHVLDSSEINAFAEPGGFVFVTTGALALMTNEAQLAGVLGHEVGHVAKKHGVAAMQSQLAAQGLSTAILGKNANQLITTGSNIVTGLILKGFGRGQEEQADSLGTQYSYQAGYDGRGLSTFLNTLSQAVGDTPTWLVPVSDHPRSDDRIKLLDTMLGTSTYSSETGKVTNADAFKTNVLDALAANPPSSASAAASTTTSTSATSPTATN